MTIKTGVGLYEAGLYSLAMILMAVAGLVFRQDFGNPEQS